MIELYRPTWRNAKRAAQWENTLATYVHPVMGRKRVDDISRADVMEVLSPIWTSKAETASRVRQRIETVMDWAIAPTIAHSNPPSTAPMITVGTLIDYLHLELSFLIPDLSRCRQQHSV